MSASTVFREAFHSTINTFVTQLTQNSEIAQFSMALMSFLVVVLAFQEYARFIVIGLDIESITQATLMVFMTIILFTSYVTAFDVLNEAFDYLGLLMLKISTGNSDPFYLYKWVTKSFVYMHGEDGSIWSYTLQDAQNAVAWYVIATILQIAMYLIGSWAVWSLALAKILGPLFVPFLVHPATRPLFDGWMKFTLGSLMLLVVLRASGALVAMGIKAQFIASGILQCSYTSALANCNFVAGRANTGLADAGDTMTTMVISILFVVGSIALTRSIVGNVASPSKSASKGMSAIASKAWKTNAGAQMINAIKGMLK